LQSYEQVLVVIGGGAAGIFGAIRAKNVMPQLKVLVIEKGKPLTKVRNKLTLFSILVEKTGKCGK